MMFTGIVDHCGKVKEAFRQQNALSLLVECQFEALQEGESIAVDGVCLTAFATTPGVFRAEVSSETLRLTRIEQYQSGTLVNLERALALSDRLGGHLVTGHVDHQARVQNLIQEAEFTKIIFGATLPSENGYLITKGCVSVNGVSLTVNAVTADGFEVMLVPYTLSRTNLSLLKVGDLVNIEFDWLTKIVVGETRRTLELLKEGKKNW